MAQGDDQLPGGRPRRSEAERSATPGTAPAGAEPVRDPERTDGQAGAGRTSHASDALAWAERAALLERAGDPAGAERAYVEALGLDPGLWQAWANLGALYLRNGVLDPAVAALGRALRLRPTDPDVWANLGAACRELGLHDKAAEAYGHAVELRPGDLRLRSARMFSMLYRPGSSEADWMSEGRAFEAAFGAMPSARRTGGWARRVHEPRTGVGEESLHTPTAGPGPAPGRDAPATDGESRSRDPHRRLRVGYLGADFRDHAQAMFIAPLLDHHDRSEVEVHVFDVGTRHDAVTARLMRSTDVWHAAAGDDDDALAARIRAAGIDVLVDLTLHMAGGRPGAIAKGEDAAPVRVAYLAYPSTTGLTWYTHRIVDVNTEPPGAPSAEKLLTLPQTFWCYDPLEEVHGTTAVGPLPALSGGGVTFVALNAFSKVTGETLAMCAEVLRAVRGSRLLMLAPEGSARRRVTETLARVGVDAERVEFTSPLPRRDYLAVYGRADVALDTWPVGGHTTTLDALWMGVPVVSREGPTALGRAGRTLLGAVGLSELVTGSAAEFVSAAAGLACDLPRLGAIRAGLRERMRSSAVMDGHRFARDMETAYRSAWEKWCDGDL